MVFLRQQIAYSKGPWKQYLWVLMLLMGFSGHKAHYPVQFGPTQLQADLQLLETAMKEAHTGLYAYQSQAAVDSAFQATREQIQDSLSYLDWVKLIAKLQHFVACGHSTWEHSPDYQLYRKTHLKLFPFDIRILNGKYYIWQNNSADNSIPVFTEIIHINGQPVKQITDKLRSYMNRDGNSGLNSTLEIARFFPMAYSNFIDQPELFLLQVRLPGTRIARQLKILPLLQPEIERNREQRYGKHPGMGQPLQLQCLDTIQTAIYTLRWFRNEYIQSQGQDFQRYTDSVFQVLQDKGIRKLVLDLRGNTGGWTANGAYLLSYFISKPQAYVQSVKVWQPQDYSFAQHILQLPGYDSTIRLERLDKGYTWANYPSLQVEPAPRNHFEGQVYVLTDGFTRSAAAIFCSLLRENTRAVFIGEETGASRTGAGGMVMSIKLPNTGVRVHFSTARYQLAVSDSTDARGVMPDISYQPTLEDWESGRDGALQVATTLY